MQACFLSIAAMFESIHPYFPIFTTLPQGLGAPPTKLVLPPLLAPHWGGWQERRHRQQGVGCACQRVLPPCWVTGIRTLLWSVDIPFREDTEEEGRQRPTGATWHSPYGRIELVPLVITEKTNRCHQYWFYLCDLPPNIPSVCLCMCVCVQHMYLCRWRTWILQHSTLLCSRIWTPGGRLQWRGRERERWEKREIYSCILNRKHKVFPTMGGT